MLDPFSGQFLVAAWRGLYRCRVSIIPLRDILFTASDPRRGSELVSDASRSIKGVKDELYVVLDVLKLWRPSVASSLAIFLRTGANVVPVAVDFTVL